MRGIKYTAEEDAFLRENVHLHTYPELVDLFNRTFGKTATYNGLQQHCTKTLGLKPYRANYHEYTDREKEWLMEHIDNGTLAELTEMFNAEFDVTVPRHSISDMCFKVLKLKKVHNKGRFEKGGGNSLTYPIGAERKYDGYWYVKVDDKYHEGKTTSKMFRENWKQKQVVVYEQAHGKIPDGHFVVFLDTDRENFAIDNLYCIDRKTLAVMNSKSWFKTDPALTLTAIKWCELHYALKEMEETINEQPKAR